MWKVDADGNLVKVKMVREGHYCEEGADGVPACYRAQGEAPDPEEVRRVVARKHGSGNWGRTLIADEERVLTAAARAWLFERCVIEALHEVAVLAERWCYGRRDDPDATVRALYRSLERLRSVQDGGIVLERLPVDAAQVERKS